MVHDNQIDSETFLAMLEYLYTGHAPLDKGVDPVTLLILADKYNITRLTNLCELYITKFVEQKCFKSIEKADVDVIGLLSMAQVSIILLVSTELVISTLKQLAFSILFGYIRLASFFKVSILARTLIIKVFFSWLRVCFCSTGASMTEYPSWHQQWLAGFHAIHLLLALSQNFNYCTKVALMWL